MPPTFSIIIPTRNRPEFLRRAVDSVRAQCYEDWEMIVVDDGSMVPAIQVLTSLDDTRINLVRNEESHGPHHARAQGLLQARADHLCFLDDDDYFLPHHLQEVHDFYRALPDKQTMIVTGIITLRRDGSLVQDGIYKGGKTMLTQYWHNPISLLPFVLPRSIALRHPLPREHSPIEDFEWLVTLLLHEPAIQLPVYTVVYAEHESNRTNHLITKQDLLAREEVIRRLVALPGFAGQIGRKAIRNKITHQRLHWSRQCMRHGLWRNAVFGVRRAVGGAGLASIKEIIYTIWVALRTLPSSR